MRIDVPEIPVPIDGDHQRVGGGRKRIPNQLDFERAARGFCGPWRAKPKTNSEAYGKHLCTLSHCPLLPSSRVFASKIIRHRMCPDRLLVVAHPRGRGSAAFTMRTACYPTCAANAKEILLVSIELLSYDHGGSCGSTLPKGPRPGGQFFDFFRLAVFFSSRGNPDECRVSLAFSQRPGYDPFGSTPRGGMSFVLCMWPVLASMAGRFHFTE